MQIKVVHAGDGIRELIPRNDAGIVVYALAPGERSLDLEAMVESLHNPQLETFIGGTASPVQITDIAGVIVELRRGTARFRVAAVRIGLITVVCRIPEVSEDIDFRPEITRTGECGWNQVTIVDTERLMNPVRPNVTNRRREVAK